jgi:hypothetical protein
VTSVNLITDWDTGRPKSFGFEFEGRTLKIDTAKELQPRAPRTGGHGGGSRRW